MKKIAQLTQIFFLIILSTFGLCAVYYVLWTAAAHRMAKLAAAGKLPPEKFHASYNAWKNHISHGNCYRLGRTMDVKIKEILQEVPH